MDILDIADRMLECFGLEGSLQVTKIFLEEIGTKKMADYLQTLCIRSKLTLMCIFGFLLLSNLSKRRAYVLKKHFVIAIWGEVDSRNCSFNTNKRR